MKSWDQHLGLTATSALLTLGLSRPSTPWPLPVYLTSKGGQRREGTSVFCADEESCLVWLTGKVQVH